MVFGVIPVAILGLAFYVVAVPLFSPVGLAPGLARRLHVVRLGSGIVGMGFVMYLISRRSTRSGTSASTAPACTS